MMYVLVLRWRTAVPAGATNVIAGASNVPTDAINVLGGATQIIVSVKSTAHLSSFDGSDSVSK